MAKKTRKSGAGAPRKPLNVRILEGNPGKRPLSRLEFADDARDEATAAPPDFLPAQAAAIFEGERQTVQRLTSWQTRLYTSRRR